jgi:hypothetical protein
MSELARVGRLITRLVRRTGRGGAPGGARRTGPTGARTVDADVDGVVVGYAPTPDGDADPGEVVWTWVPYEDDPRQGKDRPVVVIGTTGDGALAVVPLSSKDHADRADHDEWVLVGSGRWDSSGRESSANVDRVLRVAPGEVRREGAVLDRSRFDAVVAGVRRRHPTLA